MVTATTQDPSEPIQTSPSVEEIITEQQEWVKQMRLKFCVREEFEITKNIIHKDGTLNQE